MALGQTKTQDFVNVKDISSGIVVLKNGGLRQIVMVDGLNFDLKSEGEQNTIIYAYQNLLNSLDFSVQVFIHSRKLNIDDYLRTLDERMEAEQNNLLREQIEDYTTFIKGFVETNAVMTKSFFVVVPFDPVINPRAAANIIPRIGAGTRNKPTESPSSNPTIEPSHREQLAQRVEQVINALRGVGLRAVALEDQELAELLHNFYNPRTVEKLQELSLEGGHIEDVLAPQKLEIGQNYLKIGDKFARSFYILGYPRYLSTGWFSPLINLPELMDISIFTHPIDTAIALHNLRKKTTALQADIDELEQKGVVRDPVLETALNDVEALRDKLQQAQEKLFDVGIYLTIYADDKKELNKISAEVEDIMGGKLVDMKAAVFEQIKLFSSVAPLGQDTTLIHTPMNSGPASSIFPFVSLDLTSDTGIMYGINRHNNTLIIFDRFSLENANMVVFAKAGAGKSYAAKLEIIRSLMMGTDVIVVDPENEYITLADAVGGSVLKISLDSESTINPFDIPVVPEDEEPNDVLKSHVVNLAGLIKLMLGSVTPAEEALIDRALNETYAMRDIAPDKDFSKARPPLLEDLEAVLNEIEGGKGMAERLYRFTKGSYAGFVNKPTNINISNHLIVFSIRDLEDELRPVAMYIILNFIWNTVRAELKKRIMVIDEAWWMMKYPDSASFLFGLAKRGRKYYLGISTITQDVDDFLGSPYGKPIITNSSLQLLLKEAPASIDNTGKAFNLTDAEKDYLVEADVGQGLFVAGLKHAAIQIVPSSFENQLITTNPEEILEEKGKSAEPTQDSD
ncbi:MAG: ATP-binding protein [Patescibacteria group bacterium]|nr:ATP-binding protein [Patescibacteria group bacterium]MCL5224127.1 ATP-binding protein [Patescibacteria group bacterium]